MARLETKYIVIHCSQTRPSQNTDAKEIDRWHRSRGWLKIGYAKVIKRDGTVEQGRGDDELQAHVKEYNHVSTSVCIIGGANEDNWREPEDNFTAEQWESLKTVLEELVIKYPEAKIVGHYDLDERKTCPNFNVSEYLLNEDIKDYKFTDSTTTHGDIEEMKDAGKF